MSPKLCCFTFMSGAEGEDTRGKGWSRTTIIGFSVRCIDLLCYLPILRRAEVSNLIRCRTHNLADWFLAFRIYSPFENRVNWRATDWRNGGWLRRLHYHVGFYLLLRCTYGSSRTRPFRGTNTLHGADGLSSIPGLHVRLFRNYTYTYLQRYWVALYSV